MADNDYAIIVGVRYSSPDFNTLKGPDNDAVAFYEWVKSPEGGAVLDDETHIKLITSSRFPDMVEPTARRVEEAFEDLNKIADENRKNKKGSRFGRRLYLYFAGHGVAPTENETAVLMADATRNNLNFHIIGQYCANTLFHAYFFEEVVLIMDCCREVAAIPVLNRSLRIMSDDQAINKVKIFYCYACKWSQKTREKELPPNNQVRGIFTTALLEGLKGAASDNYGRITPISLFDYLKNFTQCYLTEEERQDPNIPNEPDFSFKPEHQQSIVFTKLKPQNAWGKLKSFFGSQLPLLKYKVTISVPPDSEERRVDLLDHKLNVIDSKVLSAASQSWELTLEPGMYVAEIPAEHLQERFTVGCRGSINVHFGA